MLLTIIQILIFIGWISFTTYSVFDVRKKIRTLAKKNKLKVPFECKKCQTIHQYSFEEYTKIVHKVRNETTIKTFNSVKRTKEYKYPCPTCGSKQWQVLQKINPFVGTPYQKEYFSIIKILIFKIFTCGILVVLFLSITEALSK